MRLIDADVLLEKFAGLEATALDMCKRHMYDDDLTLWKRWSVLLAERTAYKYDVVDAPTVDVEPCWIPCSERLPEAPFGCLVTVEDEEPMTGALFPNLLPYFVGWDGEQWNDADGEQCPFEVLAWMPLPKPYEVKEHD